MTRASGFTLIEVLFASSLLLSFFLIVIPIASNIHVEQEILRENRNISESLHQELQTFLWSNDTMLPAGRLTQVDNQEVYFEFTRESDYIKGCADWNDAKERSKTFCLYGLQKQ